MKKLICKIFGHKDPEGKRGRFGRYIFTSTCSRCNEAY